MASVSGGRFSSLLLEGLDEYRRGNMQAAVRAWEEAYTLEPTNPRAREFLHSALERIYAQMGVTKKVTANGPPNGPVKQQTPVQRVSMPPAGSFPQRTTPASAQAGAAQAAAAQAAVARHEESEAEVLLGGARDLFAQKDYAHALELLAKVLAAEPENTEARTLAAQCERVLTQQFEAKIGPLERRPRVLLKPDEIRWLDLDPRAGFILAQIDGAVSYEDLYDICGLQRLDTVRILAQLVDEKIIGHGPG